MNAGDRLSHVRSKDTGPEIWVRCLVHRMGYRYRLHASDLPGRPDLVFRSRQKVIFVHGCYWHRHECCPKASTPKTNREYWLAKFNRNVARDTENKEALQQMGWSVLVIWECEMTDERIVAEHIKAFLDETPKS